MSSAYRIGGIEKQTVLQGPSDISRVGGGGAEGGGLDAVDVLGAVVGGAMVVIIAVRLVIGDMGTRGGGIDGGAEILGVRLERLGGLREGRELRRRHGCERIRQVSKNARGRAGRCGGGARRAGGGTSGGGGAVAETGGGRSAAESL